MAFLRSQLQLSTLKHINIFGLSSIFLKQDKEADAVDNPLGNYGIFSSFVVYHAIVFIHSNRCNYSKKSQKLLNNQFLDFIKYYVLHFVCKFPCEKSKMTLKLHVVMKA